MPSPELQPLADARERLRGRLGRPGERLIDAPVVPVIPPDTSHVPATSHSRARMNSGENDGPGVRQAPASRLLTLARAAAYMGISRWTLAEDLAGFIGRHKA